MPLFGPLVLGIGLAALLGYAADAVRVPPFVAYVLAGVLVGPHTPGPVLDGVLASELVWIGGMLLLFRAGIGEAPAALDRLHGLAVVGALVQILTVTGLGWTVCRMLDWGPLTALATGLSLAAPGGLLSPRILAATGISGLLANGVLVGWVTAAGLFVVICLTGLWVLAPDPEAVSRPGIAAVLVVSIGGMATAAAAVLVGRHVLPRLQALAERTESPELLALVPPIVSLSIVLTGAVFGGIPTVLGAFLGGITFAATQSGWRAVRWAVPLRDVCAVLILVPVGAMFDPASLDGRGMEVVMVGTAVIAGRPMTAWGVACAAGCGRNFSRLLAMGVGPPGEFSFLVLALASAAGLIRPEARDVVLVALLGATLLWAPLLGRPRERDRTPASV